MNSETKARLLLINSISPGSEFWCEQVAKNGAETVVQGILGNFYYKCNQSIEKLKFKIRQTDTEAIITKLKSKKTFFIDPQHELWPITLNRLPNPPIGLLLKGDIELIGNVKKSISIVGTRKPSSYGLNIATTFAHELSRFGFTIVSGGAIGIDSAAHNGALSAEGKTISILGSGFEKKYPKSNTKLFERIEESGLLISEVMPDVDPKPNNFLIRNRLIAALSNGTIVVEAAFKSGSIRTARDAAELYKPVMAIPGQINVPTSEGCHRLITERCAELVTSVSEVLELVNPLT